MNARLRGSLGLLGLAALLQGCQVEIINNDDCGPKPDIGACGGALECVDGEWIASDTAGCDCPFGEPAEGEACSGVDTCSYPSEVDCDGTATYQCSGASWVAIEQDTSCHECPFSPPSDGSACADPGMRCEYFEEVDCGGNTTYVVECTEDGWVSYVPRCQPEPICPALAPEPGTDCTGWYDAYYCQFSLSCSPDAFIDLHCDLGTTPPLWVVDYVQPCPGSCSAAGDSETCALTQGCQWLQPGCSDELQQPIAEGCYPNDDCLITGCDDNQTCAPFVYDPCVDSGCNACGAEYNACVTLKLGGGD